MPERPTVIPNSPKQADPIQATQKQMDMAPKDLEVFASDPFPRVLALFALDSEDDHFPAQVITRERDFYWLRTADVLREGRCLVLVDGAFRFKVEVTVCHPEPDYGYRLGCKVLAYNIGTVRQEWRMPVNIAARITILLAGRTYVGRVRDSSPFGLGLELPIAVEPNTAISVRTRDGHGYGEVRHCRALPGGKYFAGVYLREYRPFPSSAPVRAVESVRRSMRRLYIATLGFANKI